MSEAVNLFMTANGDEVAGEPSQTTHGRADSIECVSFHHDMGMPIEHGGRPSGRMASHGIKIEKGIDKASPLLQKALENSETIEGRFLFFRPNPAGDGTLEQFFTVSIANARITGINRESWNLFSQPQTPPTEEIHFVAGQVTWTYESTGAEHTTEFFASGA